MQFLYFKFWEFGVVSRDYQDFLHFEWIDRFFCFILLEKIVSRNILYIILSFSIYLAVSLIAQIILLRPYN